mmetsp:Transcript_22829/g.52608  ORF Transcript_22829/g.52608 Transcript_22829/m.52608 type:complete len:127 (+) Transcript_22829:942-1322(+)
MYSSRAAHALVAGAVTYSAPLKLESIALLMPCSLLTRELTTLAAQTHHLLSESVALGACRRECSAVLSNLRFLCEKLPLNLFCRWDLAVVRSLKLRKGRLQQLALALRLVKLPTQLSEEAAATCLA